MTVIVVIVAWIAASIVSAWAVYGYATRDGWRPIDRFISTLGGPLAALLLYGFCIPLLRWPRHPGHAFGPSKGLGTARGGGQEERP